MASSFVLILVLTSLASTLASRLPSDAWDRMPPPQSSSFPFFGQDVPTTPVTTLDTMDETIPAADPLDKLEKDLVEFIVPAMNKTIQMAVSIMRTLPKLRVQRDTNAQMKNPLSSFFHFGMPSGVVYEDDQVSTTTLLPSTTTMEPFTTDSSVTTVNTPTE